MANSKALKTIDDEIGAQYRQLIAQAVDDRIREIMADKQSQDFRPFHEVREVADEMRRRQTVAERVKWPTYMEEHGCYICGRKDRPHLALGHCQSCFSNRQKRLSDIRRRLMADAPEPPQVRDGVEMARKALLPSIEKLARKRRNAS